MGQYRNQKSYGKYDAALTRQEAVKDATAENENYGALLCALNHFTPTWQAMLGSWGITGADADDLLAQLNVDAITNVRYLREPQAFQAFFCTHLRRLAIKHTRRKSRTVTLTEYAAHGVEDGAAVDAEKLDLLRDDLAPDGLTSVLRDERRQVARAAIAALSPEHREAALLYYGEERSLAEIAAEQGVPVGTVKSRLHSARTRVQRYAAAYFAD